MPTGLFYIGRCFNLEKAALIKLNLHLIKILFG